MQLGSIVPVSQLLERTSVHIIIPSFGKLPDTNKLFIDGNVEGETYAPLWINVSFHHSKCLMQNIFKDHNCKVITQFNSHRKYTELSAYLSLQWGQNWVFLASKIRKLHFSKWAFDNSLLFQSTEFKTPLLTVLCLRQKCQLFNCAKHRKCKSHVYTKHKDDYSCICTYSTELTNNICTQKSKNVTVNGCTHTHTSRL